MTTQGVDALGHPSPAALKAAGKHFVACYLKDTTKAEIAAYLHEGLGVVLIAETTGRRSLGGYAAGVADASTANLQARALGAPSSVAIYFAEDDFDVQPSQLPGVIAYAHGLSATIGSARVGWYGGLRAIEAVQRSGYARFLWQTYAWSGGAWAPGDAIQQYLNSAVSVGSVTVDLDRAVLTLYGAWSIAPPLLWPPLTGWDRHPGYYQNHAKPNGPLIRKPLPPPKAGESRKYDFVHNVWRYQPSGAIA